MCSASCPEWSNHANSRKHLQKMTKLAKKQQKKS